MVSAFIYNKDCILFQNILLFLFVTQGQLICMLIINILEHMPWIYIIFINLNLFQIFISVMIYLIYSYLIVNFYPFSLIPILIHYSVLKFVFNLYSLINLFNLFSINFSIKNDHTMLFLTFVSVALFMG